MSNPAPLSRTVNTRSPSRVRASNAIRGRGCFAVYFQLFRRRLSRATRSNRTSPRAVRPGAIATSTRRSSAARCSSVMISCAIPLKSTTSVCSSTRVTRARPCAGWRRARGAANRARRRPAVPRSPPGAPGRNRRCCAAARAVRARPNRRTCPARYSPPGARRRCGAAPRCAAPALRRSGAAPGVWHRWRPRAELGGSSRWGTVANPVTAGNPAAVPAPCDQSHLLRGRNAAR